MSDETSESNVSPAKRGLARILTAQKALLNIAAQQNTVVGGMLKTQVDAKNPTAGAILGSAQQAADTLIGAQRQILDQGLSMLGLTAESDANMAHAEASTRAALTEAMNAHRELLENARIQSQALTGLADSEDKSVGKVARSAKSALENFVAAQQVFLKAATDQADRAVHASAPELARPDLKKAADEAIDKYTEAQRQMLVLTEAYAGSDSETARETPGMGALAQKGIDRFIDAQHGLLNLAQLALYAPPPED